MIVALTTTLVAVPAARNGRDLGPAPPESVGVSSERLERLEAGMQQFVETHRLAGVTTLLARRGKIVQATTFGRKDSRKPTRSRAIRSSAFTR